MKNSIRLSAALSLTSLLAAPLIQAQEQPAPASPPPPAYQTQTTTVTYGPAPFGMYVNADLGGNLVQKIRIRSAGGAGGGYNSVDGGFRADAAFGMRFSENFSTEFEAGALGNWLDVSAGQPLSSVSSRAYLEQLPLLANAIFTAPLQCGLKPYLGVGAGGIVSTLHSRLNGDWDRDTDFTFAYQGTAGLKYALTPHIDLGLAYKFLGTLDHTWFGDDASRVVHADSVFNHGILATFTWNF